MYANSINKVCPFADLMHTILAYNHGCAKSLQKISAKCAFSDLVDTILAYTTWYAKRLHKGRCCPGSSVLIVFNKCA